MMPTLEPQKHAMLSLAVLITMLVVFYSIVIHPAISARMKYQERHEDLLFQFSKLGDMENRSNQLEIELEKLATQSIDKTGFLDNKPEALAAADLQKHIKTLIELNEGNLISTQVIPQQEVDIFPQVTVKVHLRGNIKALQHILYRLNFDFPVLLVDNLLIQKRHASGGRRAQQGADQLEVRFDITGFIYQDEAI